MTGKTEKVSLEEERELVLETSLEERFIDDRKAHEKAEADTRSVMAKHRNELHRSILEMTNPA